jgi:hypothetical protein
VAQPQADTQPVIYMRSAVGVQGQAGAGFDEEPEQRDGLGSADK